MANLTKSLIMPNGQEYEFVGKHWYGTCTSSATAQTKSVTITGFASADFVNGTQITIQFSNAQNYSNTPFFININSLGARIIYESQGTYARQYEWKAGSVITFCYIGGSWYIIDGGHADTTYFGKTKLSNTIADDQTTALTPKAVYDAGYVNASGAAAAAPVQSVNGQTGAVSLTIPTVPTDVSDFNNDAGYITSADIPVTSVNTKTGSVVLSASDVGALPDSTTIPSKTSDLTNDSGFITGMVILSYGSSTWADFLAAYRANKVVYCRASSNANPASGSQTRLAFMAYVNNETNPTNVEFQYYRSISSHTAAQQGDQVFVYTLTSSGWTVTTREAAVKVVAGTNMTQSYSKGTLTLQAVQPTVPTNVSAFTNDAGYLTLADLPIYQGGVS